MGKSSPNGPANGQRKRPSFLKALFLTATFPNLNLISRFLLLQFTELHTHSIVNLQNYFLPGNLESEIAGFAAAILLRILDPAREGHVRLSSLKPILLQAVATKSNHDRPRKGAENCPLVAGFLEGKASYLAIAFKTINWQSGSFDQYVYVRQGLDLTQAQIEHLRMLYLQ